MLMRIAGTAVAVSWATITVQAEAWIRWNQQGYAPDAVKIAVVMSETDLEAEDWELVDAAGGVVLAGNLAASITGAGPNSPMAFHHPLDFSALAQPGDYTLQVPDAAPAKISVRPRPYAELANLPLQHLRIQRSGTDTVLWRRASHSGDAEAPVRVPTGDPGNGAWRDAEPARTVDASGGWYDAGDHIKFTLTTAYTAYHLLVAYEVAPMIFTRIHSTTGLVDLLDEAAHGLDYLAKLLPDDDTFIIQIGDARDHNQGWRLPADDALDGERPALTAPAQVQLYSTAAALARGARIFAVVAGQEDRAARYAAAARSMFARAQKSDTIPVAFERDQVNDFYRDDTVADQACLAALELAALTGDSDYAAFARKHRPGAAGEVGWADWNWLANRELTLAGDATGRADWVKEVAVYEQRARSESGAPWGQPSRFVWGSLTRWIGAANAAQVAHSAEGRAGEAELFRDMRDYVFGRNPWGVSFLYDERLPNTLRNLYSPTAHLLPRFPTGAFSAGPAPRGIHEEMRRYFENAADDPFERFNTEAMVFYDNAHDFVCQEATIGGQADIVLMLALAARANMAEAAR